MGEEVPIVIKAGAGWGKCLCSRPGRFNPGKHFPVLTERKTLRKSKQAWAFCERDKFLARVGRSNHGIAPMV